MCLNPRNQCYNFFLELKCSCKTYLGQDLFLSNKKEILIAHEISYYSSLFGGGNFSKFTILTKNGTQLLHNEITVSMIRLTNRFHVAVHLSFNRSQMTSKCGKNKKVAHEAIAECVTDVLTTF